MKVSEEEIKRRNKKIFLYLIKLHRKEMNQFPMITTVPHISFRSNFLISYTNWFNALNNISFDLFDKYIIYYTESEGITTISLKTFFSIPLQINDVARLKNKADVSDFLINN
jgi:hypothetical protein